MHPGLNTYVDVMAQYYPEHKAIGHAKLGREITDAELKASLKVFADRGFTRLDHRFEELRQCSYDTDKLSVLFTKDMEW